MSSFSLAYYDSGKCFLRNPTSVCLGQLSKADVMIPLLIVSRFFFFFIRKKSASTAIFTKELGETKYDYTYRKQEGFLLPGFNIQSYLIRCVDSFLFRSFMKSSIDRHINSPPSSLSFNTTSNNIYDTSAPLIM